MVYLLSQLQVMLQDLRFIVLKTIKKKQKQNNSNLPPPPQTPPQKKKKKTKTQQPQTNSTENLRCQEQSTSPEITEGEITIAQVLAGSKSEPTRHALQERAVADPGEQAQCRRNGSEQIPVQGGLGLTAQEMDPSRSTMHCAFSWHGLT